ncbi:MAG: hypothetical protein Q8P21_00925 [bacterium]|nr:hypothetical protein [bacterium]
MKIRPLSFKQSGLTPEEWRRLKKLSSPQEIQDFLNATPFNFERGGETHSSVRYALKRGRVHCFEGALIAAAALWIKGQRPLLLDLKTVRPDFDHVVALFRKDKFWGAISKTNHAVLRYREPVYHSVRELAMSYFHEYFLLNGKKTLRQYSKPFDLSRFHLDMAWLTTKKNLADLAHKLDKSPHVNILSAKQIKNLRKADEIEIKASEIVEYKK